MHVLTRQMYLVMKKGINWQSIIGLFDEYDRAKAAGWKSVAEESDWFNDRSRHGAALDFEHPDEFVLGDLHRHVL